MLTAVQAFISLNGSPDSIDIRAGRLIVQIGGIEIDGGDVVDTPKSVASVLIEAALTGGVWRASKLVFMGNRMTEPAPKTRGDQPSLTKEVAASSVASPVPEPEATVIPLPDKPALTTVNAGAVAGPQPTPQGARSTTSPSGQVAALSVFAQRMKDRQDRERVTRHGQVASAVPASSGVQPRQPSAPTSRPAASSTTQAKPAARAAFNPNNLGADDFQDVPF